jgi:hypothetical protein
MRDLRHVREAYLDFCAFREGYARRYRDRDEKKKHQRIAARRRELHARMKRREKRDAKTALW